jgi:hypothetical protein
LHPALEWTVVVDLAAMVVFIIEHAMAPVRILFELDQLARECPDTFLDIQTYKLTFSESIDLAG